MSQWNRKNVVYKVLCQDCDMRCVGETKRTMEKWLTEIEGRWAEWNWSLHLQVHTNTPLTGTQQESKPHSPRYWSRRTPEAIQIHRTPHPMDMDCGLQLSPVWNPLMDLPDLTNPRNPIFNYVPINFNLSQFTESANLVLLTPAWHHSPPLMMSSLISSNPCPFKPPLSCKYFSSNVEEGLHGENIWLQFVLVIDSFAG